MTKTEMSLRQRLQQNDILVAPGVFDALSAVIASKAGFDALYLSGAAVAYARLGRPDIGLTSANEMAETMSLIADRVDTPVIMDADAGFGNALNSQRTMQLYERAGACALQLEDQQHPKRCGHLADKRLITPDLMCGKIKAMIDARRSENTLLVARTDAIAVEGFEAALTRADAYLQAGADVLFIEAPQTREQLVQIGNRYASQVPLLANMVEGGSTPITDAKDLQNLGFSIAIFPGGIVRALARTAQDYYNNLYAQGSNRAFSDRMFDFNGLNDVLGTSEMLEQGKRYSSDDE